MARTPNFKQEKKRREEAQKQRNQAKQREKAERRSADVEPSGTAVTADTYKNQGS